MTEPKTAPERKSSTSFTAVFHCWGCVTAQAGAEQKKRLFISPSSTVLLLEAPDTLPLGDGDFSSAA